MTGQVVPFEKPCRLDPDGSPYAPPPVLRRGTVYVFYATLKPKQRKKRWFIMTEFLDQTYEEEEGPSDWASAMTLAKVRARKHGFGVSDLSDLYVKASR